MAQVFISRGWKLVVRKWWWKFWINNNCVDRKFQYNKQWFFYRYKYLVTTDEVNYDTKNELRSSCILFEVWGCVFFEGLCIYGAIFYTLMPFCVLSQIRTPLKIIIICLYYFPFCILNWDLNPQHMHIK